MDKKAKMLSELEELKMAEKDSSTPAEALDGIREAITNLQKKIDGYKERKPKAKAEPKSSTKTATVKKPRGAGKPNPDFAKVQQIAKNLKAKDPSLKHTKAVSMAWAEVRGGAPAKTTTTAEKAPEKKAEPKKLDKLKVTAKPKETAKKAVVKKASEAPKKKNDLIEKVKRAKAKVKRVGKTYSYKQNGEVRTFQRDKKKDGLRTAKHVGRRVSKEGNVYYEYRDNRADVNIGKVSYKRPSLYAKGGETGKKYMVFNYTDNIYASPEVFNTKKEANEFIKSFRKRFEMQGYYRDNRMNKIDIEDIDLLAIPSDFSPFRKFAKGGKTKGKVVVKVRSYNYQNTLLMQKSFETERQAEKFADKILNYNDDGYVFSLCGYDSTGKKVIDIYDLSEYSKSDVKKEKGFADCKSWNLKMKVLDYRNVADYRNTVIYEFTGTFDACFRKFNLLDGEDLYADYESSYAKGGQTKGMYKIVDVDGKLVKSNLTEQDVIEFADTLGYYESQDNDEERISDVDSAISLIEMEGDYEVVKMSMYGGYYAKGGSAVSGVKVEVRLKDSPNILVTEKIFDTKVKAERFAQKVNKAKSDPIIDIVGYDSSGKMVVKWEYFSQIDEYDIEAGIKYYKPVTFKMNLFVNYWDEEIDEKYYDDYFGYPDDKKTLIYSFSGSYEECYEKFDSLVDKKVIAKVIESSFANGGEMDDENQRFDVNPNVTSTLANLQPYLDEYTMRKFGSKFPPETIFVEYYKRPDGTAQIEAVTLSNFTGRKSKRVTVDEIFETYARGGEMGKMYRMPEEKIVS